MTPTLLFLHGVGPSSPSATWRDGLRIGLGNVGYPDEVPSKSIVEPHYDDLLTESGLAARELPPETPGSEFDRRSARPAFEYAQGSLRRLLHIEEPFASAKFMVPAAIPNLAQHAPVLKQAKHYVRNRNIRAHVLGRVINQLPKEPVELVIVGHSLGSVVTVDLLAHLPEHVRVRRVVTIGSPLGLKTLEGTRMPRQFPYDRVDSWLNAFAAGDPVPLGRGVAWRYPAALDHRVRSGYGPHAVFQKHFASTYVQDDDVARAIGEALFGNRGHEIIPAPPKPAQLALTEAEATCLLGMAYGQLTLERLHKEEPKIAVRYAVASAIVRREMSGGLRRLAAADHRPLHPDVAALDTSAGVRAPTGWIADVDTAVTTLIVAATTNLVEPFDIDDEGAQLEVLDQLALSMGISAITGVHIREAVKDARKGLRPNRTWKYAGMAAAGLAIVALGPIGIAAGGAAGAAGAAAITSGLAAFGPGGMAGGIALTTILASGGAAVTTSSVVAAMAPEQVETTLVRHMSHALARKRLGLPAVFGDWLAVTQLESDLAASRAKLDGISDDDSAELKALGRKIEATQRAVQWMADHDLAPDQIEPNQPLSLVRRIAKPRRTASGESSA